MDEFRMFLGTHRFNSYVFAAEVFMAKTDADPVFLRGLFYKALQTQQTLELVDTIQDRIEEKSLDLPDIYNRMQDMVRSTMPEKSDFTELSTHNYWQEYKRALDFRATGVSELVFKHINRITGGLGLREILIFIAPPSRGKTTYLVNEFYAGLLQDEKVLYLSMENEKESIISRLSDRILLMTKAEQRRSPEFCQGFLQKFWNRVKVPVIMYRAASSYTVADLEMFIDEYELRTGERFDRIIVDYLNKFKKVKANQRSQDYDDIRKLTDDFRDMIIRRNTRGITAAQTNRSGIVNREGSLSESTNEAMIQGGFGQFETADMVLGYSETPAEHQRGEGRIAILKAREAGGRGRELVVHIG